jgi:hypothetical protein
MVRTLNRVKCSRGVPKVLFCDNGSKFTSQGAGSVGVSKRCEDGFLATRQADRQYVRGELQWDVPERMPGHSLVHGYEEGKAADRDMAARI